jgi:hypothetical protein
VNFRTRDVGRLIGTQEQNGVGDLVNFSGLRIGMTRMRSARTADSAVRLDVHIAA